jgi:hypothetical protein
VYAVKSKKPHFNTGDSGVDRMSIATNMTAIAVNRNQRSMIPFNIDISYTHLSFVSG